MVFFFVAVMNSLVVEASRYTGALANRCEIVKNLLDLRKNNSSIQGQLTELKASEKPEARRGKLFYRSPKAQEDCMLTQLVYLSGTNAPEGIGAESAYTVEQVEGTVNGRQAVFELDPWQDVEHKPVSNNFLVSAEGSRKLIEGVQNRLFANQRQAAERRDTKRQQARWCVCLVLGLIAGVACFTYKYGWVDKLIEQKIGITFWGMSVLIWWLVLGITLGPLGLAAGLAGTAQQFENVRNKLTERIDIMSTWLEQNPINYNRNQAT